MISADDKHSFEAAIELLQRASENGLAAALVGVLDGDGCVFVVATSEALAITALTEEEHDDDEDEEE